MVVESRAHHRHTAGPGELTPLDVGLSPESREFAEALRDVFVALGISLGEFAAACHRDKGAVSRYFAGKRVPPRDFVDQLIDQAQRAAGHGASAELAGRLRRLHLRAWAAHDPKAARFQALNDDIDLRTVRINDLDVEITRRMEEVHQLEQRLWLDQHSEAQNVIKDLQRELEETRAARREAEKSLAMARAAATTSSAGSDIGILGCIL